MIDSFLHCGIAPTSSNYRQLIAEAEEKEKEEEEEEEEEETMTRMARVMTRKGLREKGGFAALRGRI